MQDNAQNSIPIQVVYYDPGGLGYHCVYYMAHLAAELLGGEMIVLQPTHVGLVDKLFSLLPRSGSGIDCLLICPSPTDLCQILKVANWRQKYRKIAAWVFDSFWTQNIPGFLHARHLFDQIFVTEKEDIGVWRKSMKTPVDWLPWGSDVLRLGSDNPLRDYDLLRFGRQPSEWENDASTEEACFRRGLAFHGRPMTLTDETANQRALMKALRSTKFTLSFSNRVSPNPQTHPTREYLTGRWTDSLAAGAIVAGVPPRSETVTSLLWPEALLDLETAAQSSGLKILSRAAEDWTPAFPRLNYLRSLERLDWRWRFKQIAETLGIHAPKLERELSDLRAAIDATLLPESMQDFTQTRA